MTKEVIKEKTLEVFQTCSIQSFPVSTLLILDQLGISYFTYSQLKEKSEEVFQICSKFSQDAFTWNHIICYNETMPYHRVRFSIMHELGHILLQSGDEAAANVFASHLLVPRIILHQADYIKENDMPRLFGISRQASSVIYTDYLKNYKGIPLEMLSKSDQNLYYQFYQDDPGIFVFHMEECPDCGSILYNSISRTCYRCKTRFSRCSDPDLTFFDLEQSWLYPER